MCRNSFTANEIMKYQHGQLIDSQHGPIIEFVTEITLHTNVNKRRSDIIFMFFQFHYQIKACNLEDLDPTNAFLFPLIFL